ncbi:MAG: hypothetical protein IKZ34_03805 [Alphaproteobacteria bacterium]|nr:hypothetical protein [Alphaproteobacteria bacterium]
MRYKLLYLVAFVALVAVPAFAVTGRCVKLNPNTVCAPIWDDYNQSDSRVDCDGTVVQLIGMCAQNTGTADVSVRTYLTTSTTLANNYRCWCMMAEPMISKWVLRAVYDDVEDCKRSCNIGCKNAFKYDNEVDRTFRNTIMSNFI